MDLNVIKNKAENVYGEENTTEYKEFEDKFKPKKTTDDCYTPNNIYETVADYVATRFKVDRNKFVRPFYPGEVGGQAVLRSIIICLIILLWIIRHFHY